jgi:branched-chain amino acid transport system substrate-binding protein
LLVVFALIMPCLCCAAAPITIGGSLGLSGRFAPIADALSKGFSLWERNINQSGGILGRPVTVIIEDDHSDPTVAQAIYTELIEKKRVDFLFAPYSSLITEAVLPIAEKNGIPMLIAGASADRLWAKGYKNAIGVYTPASKFTIGFLELLVRQGLDNIALVYASDPFSIELMENTQKWARRFNLTIRSLEMFRKGTADLAPVVLRAKERDAQVLMVCGHMDEAVNMARALKQIQWHPQAYTPRSAPPLKRFTVWSARMPNMFLPPPYGSPVPTIRGPKTSTGNSLTLTVKTRATMPVWPMQRGRCSRRP